MGTKISGAELEIMEHLWEQDQAETFAELLEYFNTAKKKEWCKQTLNTNLLRLKKKGLLVQEKNGAKSVYRPTITKIQYQQKCAEDILEEFYEGGLSNFIAALAGKNRITELEKEELMDYIWKER